MKLLKGIGLYSFIFIVGSMLAASVFGFAGGPVVLLLLGILVFVAIVRYGDAEARAEAAQRKRKTEDQERGDLNQQAHAKRTISPQSSTDAE